MLLVVKDKLSQIISFLTEGLEELSDTLEDSIFAYQASRSPDNTTSLKNAIADFKTFYIRLTSIGEEIGSNPAYQEYRATNPKRIPLDDPKKKVSPY